MLIKNKDELKLQIVTRLKFAEKQVEKIIAEVESDFDWKSVHGQINLVIGQLELATKQLACRHLKTCVFRRNHIPNNENLKEIFKIYKYLY